MTCTHNTLQRLALQSGVCGPKQDDVQLPLFWPHLIILSVYSLWCMKFIFSFVKYLIISRLWSWSLGVSNYNTYRYY